MPKHVGVANRANQGKEETDEDVSQRTAGKRTPRGLLRSAGADAFLFWTRRRLSLLSASVFIFLILYCQDAQTVVILRACRFPVEILSQDVMELWADRHLWSKFHIPNVKLESHPSYGTAARLVLEAS